MFCFIFTVTYSRIKYFFYCLFVYFGILWNKLPDFNDFSCKTNKVLFLCFTNVKTDFIIFFLCKRNQFDWYGNHHNHTLIRLILLLRDQITYIELLTRYFEINIFIYRNELYFREFIYTNLRI